MSTSREVAQREYFPATRRRIPAPACQKKIVPSIRSGKVKRYNQFYLSDDMELKAPTCKPILGYTRLPLQLVSQSLKRPDDDAATMASIIALIRQ